MGTFKIQNVLPTGENHDTYGTEYHVKFEESEKTFKLWYKTPPEVGQEVDGTVTGDKFKKTKKPFVSAQTESGEKPKKSYGAVEKDKQDGMRQGMCFNVAAAFVTAQNAKVKMGYPEWAREVYQYAQALYDLGHLTRIAEGVPETTVEDAPQAIGDIFGGNKPKETPNGAA